MEVRISSASIDDQAADWIAREDRGELSGDEATALAAWLDGDPRHLGAYARAKAVAVHFDRARALGAAGRRPAPARSGMRIWAAIGGTAAAVAIAAAFVFLGPWSSTGYQAFATEIGEIKRNALEDGSAITLNTATEVKTRMSADARSVILTHGEALFDVAADPKRPFRVMAGDVSVTAVGTSFSIRIRPDGAVDVVVREGVVEVSRKGTDPVRVSANAMLRWEAARPPVTKVQPSEEIDRTIAWRQGMIDLDGLTLKEAAAEFARYGGTPIFVPQPNVAAMTVTGLFSASNPAGFARAAALSLGLQVRPQGDGIAIVESRR